MNDEQREEHVDTGGTAVVIENEPHGRDDRVESDQEAYPERERPIEADTTTGRNGKADTKPVALFPHEEIDSFHSRWTAIQTEFVDEPRTAVEDADKLVIEAMDQLAEIFSSERSRLEKQWTQGDDVSTEQLRQTLQRYRSFFHRLLSL